MRVRISIRFFFCFIYSLAGATGSPSFVHVIVGVGEPLIGKSMVNGSPALTRISFLPRGP